MQDIDGSSLIALALLALLYWNIWDSLRLFTPHDDDAKGRNATDPSGGPADTTPDERQAANKYADDGLDHCAACAMQGILAIQSRDAAFDVARFLASAGSAYETIVTAFAAGDRAVLRNLASPDVYEAFAADIEARERDGHRTETTFVAIAPPEIVRADIAGDEAQITVRFVSELFSVTRSQTGAIVRGSADTKKITADVWSFAKTLTPDGGIWTLVATRSE
ncbi:MAG TPA: Tim44/TimA family putative adaptor protein [Xanthobacteraceae bacterium]|jgi:predicted lipid-binding transport protein (Tim44 family)|nr:Tim44/TimA family putative adaptor protein [Xanthobacteraceae bacterium]